jgi:nucleoside-diphosphate-sugar epimerase
MIRGDSPYAKTKLEAETYLLSYFPENTFILRFAPVHQGSFKLNMDRRTRLYGLNYTLGSGDKQLSLLYIHNISHTVDQIIDERIPPGVYSLSENTTYSYNEILATLHLVKHIRFPWLVELSTYGLGKLLNNHFLIENSIKLCTDNKFLSKIFLAYINVPFTLKDMLDD